MHPFTLATLAGWALVVATAARLRGRPYAAFVGVLLGLHSLGAVALFPHAGPLRPLFAYLHGTVFVHFLLLARPRMRSLAFRALVSNPAHYFVAATFLALPWAAVAAFGLTPRGLWVPYALALLGLVESLAAREELVDLPLDGDAVAGLRRRARRGARSDRPLRLVQITDPHLGPFMSEARLARICERAVARDPDLVLLTGDFLTMESQQDPGALERALAPLRALPGRVFACRGNHDHEAPEVVARALASVGARLLIDEAVTVETGAGPVQILGLDFAWRGRAERMARACAEHPRVPGALRLVLLHDPGAFGQLPEGEGDLVLSGHTHGGQLGLLRLGLPHTVVSALTKIPDHGFWARGTDRLYVHRGTGHYGFPLRLGVPAEQSLLQVHRAVATTAPGG
ncbi:MAG TPA: metallophosphoesterase [Polyangiaceae bacterium]|nr:metallophosphoesterase [Polyangiaceae bacterium]